MNNLQLGIWFYSINQRRKRRAEESKSNELPTTLSSKSVPASSTNIARRNPSHPYPNSDLQKGSTYFGAHVFSYEELEEATNNFDPSKEIGKGGFGKVYYGKLHDGRVVAVKRLHENNMKRVEQFMNEVEILSKIRHQNLVALYGCTSQRSQELILVYEYVSNGTVADHLHGNRSKSGLLTWPVRLSIAIESAEALAYLHVSDVIHRDVKTNNILLDENFQVKVADFGLSRLFPTDVTHVSTAPQGTPGYVDPEYFQCYQLTQKSDVYSFGVVLMELISSLPAVDMNRHRQDINLVNMAVNKTQNNALHELVDPLLGFEKDYTVKKMTTSVAELAFRCLEKERDMRPSMDEVLEILRGIQNGNEEMGAQKAEVVDIKAADDVRLLKNIPPPLSSDSVVTDKWVNSPTTPHSS
ncbi:LEAF RUST 10 DISEASE-RESISTANCE LOCUS RECEPTOR-LIKE PROTEIN KINASE-like 1.4 isoform X2 [Quercus lobata]|uniref:LEAF RUST 10 DISEASE-RESISTANCE LOCUS RECEPTOR-LIKE PROTEIN KINASE-like 1.4 isoform X2 n=1 Tax=Quercus lobata TaxID=97700 RepID=UPI0012491806|nr:LEAF RUST 10 DISEASE-RESISTANCE LOCUS RECEPTOR-LIKE PROTEIN KINASE-like 1.4 isoform X2 [Quercus lobata]